MRSFLFDSINIGTAEKPKYDRAVGAEEWSKMFAAIVGNGVEVRPATSMQVVAGNGMQVVVLPGACWINGHYGVVEEPETFDLDPEPSNGKDRTDIVVARLDLSLASRGINLEVVKGTSLTAPAYTRNNTVHELVLAAPRVTRGATSITNAIIADTRSHNDLCGFVTGAIDQITTTDFFKQFQAEFDAFMKNIDTELSGDVAANLLLNIENHKNDSTVHLPSILPANRGGTGAGTLTSGYFLKGGGTGPLVAQSPAAARNDIGLGNSIAALGIQYGGTDATTAAAARINLGIVEGTWTPVFASTTGWGRYQKIGNYVTVLWHIPASSSTAVSSNITGLPFRPASNYFTGSGSITGLSDAGYGENGFISNSSSSGYIGVYALNNNGGRVVGPNFSGTIVVAGSLTYQIY